MARKKIAIFCGGPSSEYEVSLKSAATIYKNINKKKYDPYFFFISKKSKGKLLIAEENINFDKIIAEKELIDALKDLKKKRMFALLAGIHGEFVEDGRLQMFLEFLQIPYSGSNSKASMIAMDKYLSTLLAHQIEGLSFPQTFLVKNDQELGDYQFPLVVKPNTLGSSVGVYIVKNHKELLNATDSLKRDLAIKEVLIQQLIDNAIEIQCGCLQDSKGKFIKLPPIEIRPKKATFFDYASKYDIGGSEEITPPVSISKNMSDKISDLACKLHELFNLNTYSRSDFMINDDKIYFLETNTLPGMTETSLLPQEAKAAGISFPELLDFIIENS